MFKRDLFPALCALAVTLFIAPAVGSQEKKKSEPSPPAPPAELKVLAPLIGEWTTEAMVGPSIRYKEGFKSQGESSAQWMHNGHFIRVEASSLSVHGRYATTTIITYDRPRKQYRQFVFTTDGFAMQDVGEWDEKTKTMNWKGTNAPEGWTTSASLMFDHDGVLFTGLAKNERGETVRDVKVKAMRKTPVENGKSAKPAK